MTSESRVARLGSLAAMFMFFSGSFGCYSTAQISSSAAPGASSGASAAGEAAPSAYSQSNDGRPGLGTVWGENRHSPVREVSFERSGDSPTFLASLLYNDREGIDALRSRIGRRYGASEPMFRTRGSAGSSGEPWSGVTIRVVDGNGGMLPTYHLGDRVLLIGEAGQRYAIEIDNRTSQRYEVVASVDGLDVIDGRTATLDKPGYVISPHGHLRIDGYRRDLNEVAAFRLGSVRDSYAAQTAEFGDRHVGVIGVALFQERGSESIEMPSVRPEVEDDAKKRESADPFPGRFSQPPTSRAYY